MTSTLPAWRFRDIPVDGERTGGDQSQLSFKLSVEVFVREVLQNSVDAWLHADAGAPPLQVRFDCREFRGAERSHFLEAVGWGELQQHLHAASAIRPDFRTAVEAMHASDEPLRVVAIHDGPAFGLDGEERGQDSRFANFARNKLLSQKESGSAGGSYGLGKSVLWAHSGWSTVFAHSEPVRPLPGGQRSRFIGIANLPSHEVGGRPLAGPGWFGLEEQEASASWSRSFEAEPARLKVLGLAREPEFGSGTSLLVPAFRADGSIEDLAQAIEQAANKWFWPALAGERPNLCVSVGVDGQVRQVRPEDDSRLAPFLHLRGLSERIVWESSTASGHEPIRLPATLPHAEGMVNFVPHRKKEVPDACEVRAMALPEESEYQVELELSKSVALLRGARMVVKYLPLRTDKNAFGLVLAGRARGDREVDQEVEQFLRRAEPPSHDEWSADAPKLPENYGPGFKGELNGLPKRLKDAVLKLLNRREDGVKPVEVPEALRKALSLSIGKSAGAKNAEGTFTFDVERVAMQRDESGLDSEFRGWSLEGRLHSSRHQPWLLVPQAWLDVDGGKVSVAVESLRLQGITAEEHPRGLVIDGACEGRFTAFCPVGSLGALAETAILAFALKARKVFVPQDGGES